MADRMLEEIRKLKAELAQSSKPELSANDVNAVRNDIQLRFKQGFLDSKFSGKLLKEALSKKFPGKSIELNQLEDGNYTFSIDGSKPEMVDPQGLADAGGEIAEQIGRFIEPVVDVGVGIATANPFAAGGSAMAFQTAREGMEASLGEGFDIGDIVGNATAATVLGEAGNRLGKFAGKFIGKGARTEARKGAEKGGTVLADKLQNRAGQVLQEKATRDLEAFTRGVDPDAFASKFQGNLRSFVAKAEGEAGNAFQAGRELAKQEGFNITTDISPLMGKLDEYAELTSDPAIFNTAKKNIDKRIILAGKKIGKTFPVDETGKYIIDYFTLSPNEVINVREGLTEIAKLNTGNPQLTQIINIKTALNDSLDQLAQQGSQSAAQYKQGIDKIRQMNEVLPERVRQKTLGKTVFDDFPSNVDKVTPKEFLKKLKSNSAFDEVELESLVKAGGLAEDKVLQREATQVIFKEALEGSGGGVLKSPNTRLKNLSAEDVKLASKFTSDPALQAAQKEGLSLTDDLLLESMQPSNRLPMGDTYNFTQTAQKLGKDEGGLGLAGEKLGGSFFTNALPMIEKANVFSQLAQNKGASLVEPGLMGAGRNTINQGFRPGLITNLAGDVGNIAGGVVNAGVGDIPKNIGNTFFTQAGKFDGISPEMLQRLGTGFGAGSSVFVNQRR